ncbi:hypothetical protein CI109_101658 [Kwoniella shandongensis]|uniref:Lysophospholipid acyltransferase n=1 Tax=Kwoniella shandongensis TaxID=1734106 RepID=A0AAJ8LH52_9TREE
MFWDPLFDKVSTLVGAEPDQLKLIAGLLISFPLGSLYIRLPPSRPNIAHLFSVIVSTIFLVPLLGLGGGMLHLLFSIAGTYLIVVTMKGPNMPWVAFCFVMGHLLFNHISRHVLSIPATTIEITGTQMVLVMKLSTFAWNIHDGRQNPETRLTTVPNPLAFLGYCFFFPSILVGPSFNYATYDSLVHHRIYRVAPPGTSVEQAKAAKRRVPYGRKRVAYLHFVIGLAFLGVYSIYSSKLSYGRILTPIWSTWSLGEKFGFVQLAGLIARTKYYAVWSLSEGACILTGLGFNGYDQKTGRTLWNRVRNVNIVGIETAESYKVLFDSWNCRTNVWLRDVVYKRLTKKGKKPGSKQSMATFVTSAVWHGIDPGQFRRYVRPYFLPQSETSSQIPKRVYDIAGWIVVQTNLNYIVAPFLLLSLKGSIQAWHRMYWYSPIVVALSMAFFSAGGRRKLKRGLDKRNAASVPRAAPPSFKISPPSPAVLPKDDVPPPPAPEDERDSSDLRWVKHALDNPSYQDSGEGVGIGVSIPDEWMESARGTPTSEKGDPLKME